MVTCSASRPLESIVGAGLTSSQVPLARFAVATSFAIFTISSLVSVVIGVPQDKHHDSRYEQWAPVRMLGWDGPAAPPACARASSARTAAPRRSVICRPAPRRQHGEENLPMSPKPAIAPPAAVAVIGLGNMGVPMGAC